MEQVFSSIPSFVVCVAAMPAGLTVDHDAAATEQELGRAPSQDTVIDPNDIIIEDVTGNSDATIGLDDMMPIEVVEPTHHDNPEVTFIALRCP